MKELYIDLPFGFTLVFAVPDGTDGWLWCNEFDKPKNRKIQTDLFAIRIVESRAGWIGVELVVLVFVVLLKW